MEPFLPSRPSYHFILFVRHLCPSRYIAKEYLHRQLPQRYRNGVRRNLLAFNSLSVIFLSYITLPPRLTSSRGPSSDLCYCIMFKSQNSGKHVQESSDVYTASKIVELKDAIGPLSGRSLKFCTDGCLRGYLEANNWNVKTAKKMLEHTMEWRSTYKPEEIRWQEVAKEGERGIMYRAGFHDRQGRTVLIIRAGAAIQKTSSIESMIRFNVYLLENALLNFRQGQDRMAWLVDFTGWSLTKSMPIRLSREFVNILQNHYPDRLAIAFLYNPPRAFEAFMKIIKYFLNNKTLEKAKFVYPKEKESVDLMKSYFDEENLPIEFGGKATMKYDHEEYSRLMSQDDLKSSAFWGTDDTPSTSQAGAAAESSA